MDFYQQFELLDLVKDDGVKTFEAKEIATGRPVRVHLFVSPKAPLQAALLKTVDRLPEEEARRILHRGKNEGTPYLVTDRLLDHKSLQDWVLAVTRTKPAEDPAPPTVSASPAATSDLNVAGAWKISSALPVAAPPPNEHKPGGEAADLLATVEMPVPTNLFASSPQVSPAANPVPAPSPAEAAIETPQAPEPIKQDSEKQESVKEEPSEFTKMFQAPVVSAPVPAKSSEKPAGEFTRMFQSTPVAPPPRSAPAAPAVAAPPRKAGEPGEFTRMFQSTSPAPANPAKPSATQGEFTRMFQRVPETGRPAGETAPAASPTSPTPVSVPGEFTGFFQTPAEQPFSSPLPPSLPAPVPPGEKAGEFTRMFGQTDMAALRETLSVAPPANPNSPSSGGATQAFAAPTALQPNVEPPVSSTPPVALGGAPQGGPGEYTRMFSAQTELTLGQAGAPAHQPMGQPPVPQVQVQLQTPQIQTPQVPNVSLPTPSLTAPAPPQIQIQQPNISLPSAPTPSVPSSLPSMQAPNVSVSGGTVGPASSKLPLILGLVGLIIVAIAVVIYFAMAKR